MTGNCERFYKIRFRFCAFLFLLYTGNDQHVRYLKNKSYELKSPHKFEGKIPFVRNCCGSLLRFTFCLNKDVCYCVL